MAHLKFCSDIIFSKSSYRIPYIIFIRTFLRLILAASRFPCRRFKLFAVHLALFFSYNSRSLIALVGQSRRDSRVHSLHHPWNPSLLPLFFTKQVVSFKVSHLWHLFKSPIKNSYFAICILLTLTSCSRIVVFDDPWCADAGRFGAECFYTLSDKSFSLDKFQWDALRAGQICTATQEPGLGYKHIRAIIEKLCANSNRCTAEEATAVQNFIQRMDAAAVRASIQ